MNQSKLITTIFTIICVGRLLGQEPIDVKAPNEEIKGIYQERHYPIKITFRVIDESINPIADADVNVGIDSLLHADDYNNYRGKTNADGLFTVESRGMGCTDVVVTKAGYYPSRPRVEWDGVLNPGGPEMHKNGGFRPWNPTQEVMLKKVGKPIPMLVRLSSFHKAPKLGEKFGFDLLVCDWVSPYGKGKVPDLLIRFDSNFTNIGDYKTNATIEFSNPDDGFHAIDKIVGSESLLKYPRTAPNDNYTIKILTLINPMDEARVLIDKQPIGYIFRIRTIKNKPKNEILSALYGKILGRDGSSNNLNPFEIDTLGRDEKRKLVLAPSFYFNIYLNPTPNDRNLEYDQRTNLAPEADKGTLYAP